MQKRARGFSVARETRLLLLTVVVSAATLLALAQFRFPDAKPVPELPRQQPLERLATEAAFEDMTAVLSRLGPRIAAFCLALRVDPAAPGSVNSAPRPYYVPALRFGDDLAVAAAFPPARVMLVTPGGLEQVPTLAQDPLRGMIVVRLPAAIAAGARATAATTDRTRTPGYAVAVEAGPGGPALRPVFIDRLDGARLPAWRAGWAVPPSVQTALPGAVLVEFDGRVLGVLSANLATVVPLANYLAAAVRAMTTGVPAPGSLGIELHDLDAALSRATGASQGAIVSHVDASGPAASLLRVGDIVLTVQGQEVLSASRLAEWLRAAEPGTTVALQVRRGDDVYDLEVPVVPAVPAVPIERSPAASARPSGHGMTLRERAGSEVFVVRVAAGSAAAEAGIVAGDVIAWMAGTERPTAAAVRRLYSEAQPGSAILISVTRGGRHRVMALEKR